MYNTITNDLHQVLSTDFTKALCGDSRVIGFILGAIDRNYSVTKSKDLIVASMDLTTIECHLTGETKLVKIFIDRKLKFGIALDKFDWYKI